MTLNYSLSGLSNNPNFSLAYGLDFTASAICAAPTSCTLAVGFLPHFPGLRQDAVIVKDASGNLLAITLLHGVGLAPELSVHPGIITTFAAMANFAGPQGLATDPLGNLYVADSINEVIKKITPGGVVTTVAGNGNAGYAGDGGPATSAKLNTPAGITLDAVGNLYIADKENNVIRKVSAITGIITTIAGNGSTSPGSSAVGDGGMATSASLFGPNDVAVDSIGNVFIADSYHGLVRKVDTSGKIWTVAGGGSGGGPDGLGDGGPALSAVLSTPSGIALDAAGNLYIADTGHNRIRFVSSGIITAVAGNGSYGYSGDSGSALTSTLAGPYGIRLDAAGNIYIADFGNNVVRELQAGAGIMSTIAGNGNPGFIGDNGSPLTAGLSGPASVAIDSMGNLFIADFSNNRIRQVDFNLQPFAFGTIGVGKESTPQTQMLFNIGNQSLNIGSLSISPHFLQQSSGAEDCSPLGAPIAAGTSCSIALSFAPQTAAAINGNLAFTSSSLNAGATQLSTPLTGIGSGTLGAAPAVNKTSLTFINQTLGAASSPQSVIISNPGTSALNIAGIWLTGSNSSDFIISATDCSTLAPGSTCSVSVTFTPSLSGLRSATLSLNEFVNSPSQNVFTQSIFLNGTVAVPQPSISPTGLVFTNEALGIESASQIVTFSNPSALPLSIGSISLSGPADFTIKGTTCGSTVAALSSCTVSAAFTPLASGPRTGTLSFTDSAGSSPQTISLNGTGATPLQFIPVTPCRIADTRDVPGPFGSPAMSAQSTRDFSITSSSCGIPATAAAYALNVTAVPHGRLAYLSVWPSGQSYPGVSTLNSVDGRVKANAAIIPSGVNGAISVYASDNTDVILDITGYFVPKGTALALAFYPLPPCRIADTRAPAGPLGGPGIRSAQTRSFSVLSSSCGVPANAQAYSLNFTAMPHGPLAFLTTWPSGQPMVHTSALNATTGAVTANAAIVPAGRNGDVSVFASDDTDLAVDINGYFASVGAAGLSMYDLAPCRVFDTRAVGTQPMTNGASRLDMAGTGCSVPATAQAYVLNATVMPLNQFSYLSLWPDTQTRPSVSTLNAYDGTVTSNMAIVPTLNGSIDLFLTEPTHILFDIFGYFAQ